LHCVVGCSIVLLLVGAPLHCWCLLLRIVNGRYSFALLGRYSIVLLGRCSIGLLDYCPIILLVLQLRFFN